MSDGHCGEREHMRKFDIDNIQICIWTSLMTLQTTFSSDKIMKAVIISMKIGIGPALAGYLLRISHANNMSYERRPHSKVFRRDQSPADQIFLRAV